MRITRIAKQNNNDEFKYNDEIRSLWKELLHKEKDRINVGFDLENDEGYKTRTKDLNVTNKNNDKYRINARISWAGGDWESPICYFKCQIQKRSYFERDDSWGRWEDRMKAIIIPVKTNSNLQISEKDKTRLVAKGADEGASSKDVNEKALWDEMQELAEERVKMYNAEDLEYDGNMGYDKVGAVRSLLEAYKK
jgi:hypothetical protein